MTPFTGRLPKLVVFDLDYTCWDCYIEFYSSPIRQIDNQMNAVRDRNSQKVSFYRELPAGMLALKKAGVGIAIASRTHATSEAVEALKGLHIPGKLKESDTSSSFPAIDMLFPLEIYPGSKINHFKAIHKKTGIPYSEMVFYDDEPRNKEVETKLGVVFVLVKNGTDRRLLDKGIDMWRERTGGDDTEEE